MANPDAVMVDIDGTLALRGGRPPYAWHRVSEDQPSDSVVRTIQALALSSEVIYVSGRDERCRLETEVWIATHVGVSGLLLMRKTGDRRKDALVKHEIYKADIEPMYSVWLVLDDRDQVVEMWRELGLTCFQVAPGAF